MEHKLLKIKRRKHSKKRTRQLTKQRTKQLTKQQFRRQSRQLTRQRPKQRPKQRPRQLTKQRTRQLTKQRTRQRTKQKKYRRKLYRGGDIDETYALRLKELKTICPDLDSENKRQQEELHKAHKKNVTAERALRRHLGKAGGVFEKDGPPAPIDAGLTLRRTVEEGWWYPSQKNLDDYIKWVGLTINRMGTLLDKERVEFDKVLLNKTLADVLMGALTSITEDTRKGASDLLGEAKVAFMKEFVQHGAKGAAVAKKAVDVFTWVRKMVHDISAHIEDEGDTFNVFARFYLAEFAEGPFTWLAHYLDHYADDSMWTQAVRYEEVRRNLRQKEQKERQKKELRKIKDTGEKLVAQAGRLAELSMTPIMSPFDDDALKNPKSYFSECVGLLKGVGASDDVAKELLRKHDNYGDALKEFVRNKVGHTIWQKGSGDAKKAMNIYNIPIIQWEEKVKETEEYIDKTLDLMNGFRLAYDGFQEVEQLSGKEQQYFEVFMGELNEGKGFQEAIKAEIKLRRSNKIDPPNCGPNEEHLLLPEKEYVESGGGEELWSNRVDELWATKLVKINKSTLQRIQDVIIMGIEIVRGRMKAEEEAYRQEHLNKNLEEINLRITELDKEGAGVFVDRGVKRLAAKGNEDAIRRQIEITAKKDKIDEELRALADNKDQSKKALKQIDIELNKIKGKKETLEEALRLREEEYKQTVHGIFKEEGHKKGAHKLLNKEFEYCKTSLWAPSLLGQPSIQSEILQRRKDSGQDSQLTSLEMEPEPDLELPQRTSVRKTWSGAEESDTVIRDEDDTPPDFDDESDESGFATADELEEEELIPGMEPEPEEENPELKQLIDMGFNAATTRAALHESGGNLQAAIELLIRDDAMEPEPEEEVGGPATGRPAEAAADARQQRIKVMSARKMSHELAKLRQSQIARGWVGEKYGVEPGTAAPYRWPFKG
jgi:hypothetical protein